MSFSPRNSLAPYLVNAVEFETDIEKLKNQLTYVYSLIATATNVRDIAFYLETEQQSGGQLFTPGNPQKNRYIFRKCYNFGALPVKNASKTMPHGLDFNNENLMFVSIYGAATDPTTGALPIPYPHQNGDIELKLTATDIDIYCHDDYSMYTNTVITLEYVKG